MRTVVALYDSFEDAQRAVQALTDAQFHNEDINLVSRDATGEYTRYFNRTGDETADEASSGTALGAGIGAVLGGLGGLLLSLGALAIPGIGPVIAAGPIVAALTGAGVGAVAGGLIGGLVDMGIPEEHAQFYAEGVRRGGTLVTVRADDEHAEHAREVLNRFNPVDMETNVTAWRNAGWSRFDPDANPLTEEELEFNRTSRMPMTGSSEAGNESRSTGMGSDWSRMDEHETQDVFSSERVDDEVRDVPVTGRIMESADIDRTNVDDWSRYDAQFHQDFLTRYGRSGFAYDYYQPAYRYGYDLRMDPRYRDYDWSQVEPEARMEYERRGFQGAWEDVKDAVRHAWENVTR